MATQKRTRNSSTVNASVAQKDHPAVALFEGMAKQYLSSAEMAEFLAAQFKQSPKVGGEEAAWVVAALLGRAYDTSEYLAQLLNKIGVSNEPGKTPSELVREAYQAEPVRNLMRAERS